MRAQLIPEIFLSATDAWNRVTLTIEGSVKHHLLILDPHTKTNTVATTQRLISIAGSSGMGKTKTALLICRNATACRRWNLPHARNKHGTKDSMFAHWCQIRRQPGAPYAAGYLEDARLVLRSAGRAFCGREVGLQRVHHRSTKTKRERRHGNPSSPFHKGKHLEMEENLCIRGS